MWFAKRAAAGGGAGRAHYPPAQNVEAGNAQGVLDGALDEFVRAELLRRAGDASAV